MADKVLENCEDVLAILHDALEQGAMGFSTSQVHTHNDGDGQPVPSRAASRAEIELLATVAGQHEGTTIELIVPGCLNGFSEEEIDFLADRELSERFQGLTAHFEAVQASARQGKLLREGMTVVIAGRPNAGKSSLMNRLAGYDAAIVTPVPGTTRDVLRERIHLDGMPLHVLDTAGLREGGDLIEEEGMRRAQAEMQRADRVLFVIDAADDPAAHAFAAERARLPADVPVTLVFNKCDLAVGLPVADTLSGPPQLSLSALTGEGLPQLRAHLKQVMGYQSADSGTVSARRRHLEALTRARQYTDAAQRLLTERRAGELVAEELRGAQQALAEVTGEFTSDDLLARIFAGFCIGK